MCAYILKTDLVAGDHVYERPAKRGAISVLVNSSPRGHRPEPAAASQERPLGGTPKRIFEIVVAALIRLILGGPVFYAQRRVGFGGQMFVCYKFRTMVENAEEVLEEYLRTNPAAAAEWNETRKLRNDPRVTCLGNVLRKSSIDELPQLFNILRGEMSLVGPRPVQADELSRYGQRARAYLQARPGLTGMWQANGRSSVDYDGRVARDCYYARYWSVGLDLLLLVKTIPALLDYKDTAF
jgi:exopolysaccharide production protein ExoY